ncbi:SAM-dependent methyltransferase [Planosporangium thailandense]|uniref:SAM-dependent methyltransferase n=1 Tax=Planosporangium thailandense TaxID=765197 RepID=A0ABX0XYJ6_9ACTN|nr:class I SAM-dependent methyltransferase [Planosporangium thailandense]NJC70450.1 SAM-dependent methyltransferase [Planosporangium thailandense]
MTLNGTAAYGGRVDLPPLVAAAVAAARDSGFALSCLPAQGELLRLLAAGVGPGVIGETGTGFGVGLAWLASGAGPDARLVSVERDPTAAAAARAVFDGAPNVEVVTGDWTDLAGFGPFDLLVLDGGGQGKGGGQALEPAEWLRPGGVVVIDDFTPIDGWPPRYGDEPDAARLHWLRHPQLLASEVRVTPEMATIVATYPGPM